MVGMGWTHNEELVCVGGDAAVRVYHLNGEFTQFSLGKVLYRELKFRKQMKKELLTVGSGRQAWWS